MERGTSKSYLVRTMLPGVLPPSYRGTAVRYFYYLTVSLNWRHAIAENNGHFKGSYSTLATSAVDDRAEVHLGDAVELLPQEYPQRCTHTASPLPLSNTDRRRRSRPIGFSTFTGWVHT
ncbi:hypothetical protein O6H91_Y460000 [Diphasiastrum complanatum]|nr:hypothetical protein O6H91_Y460000 [Diphasiastrum complanatum]